MVDIKRIPAYATEWLGSSRRHGSYGIMISLGLMIHIIQMVRYFFGVYHRDLTYYAMHTVLAALFLYLIKEDRKNIITIWIAYMLLPTVVFYFRDMLTNNIADVFVGKIGQSFLGLYLSTFMYPLWLLYGCSQSESRGAKLFLNAYIVILIIFLVGAMIEAPSFARAAGILGEKTGVPVEPRTIYEGVREIAVKTWNFVTTTPGKFREGWERQIEYAKTGYYEGKVEENVREPLGVYLENIMKAETEFYSDEDVILWGTIKARTLDEDNPIYVGLSCYTDYKDDEDKGKEGTIIPSRLKENFKIETFDEEDFSCKLGKLKTGSHNIKFFANFNFPTMAYLKTYFIDNDRRRAMLREGIDILDEYGITDKNPIATFTNGPVKIGAETTKSLPVGVYEPEEGKRTVRLGVTLENQWLGMIKNIRELVIEVPDSMSIINCEDVELGEGTKTDDGFKRYNINLPKRRFENIKTFKSFNCNLEIDDKDKLLGTTPIATRYYRIMVKYDYELESSMSINVKKVPGEVEGIPTEEIPTVTGKWFRVKATEERGGIGFAYDEKVYHYDHELFAALPSGGLKGKKIDVKYDDKIVRNIPILDKGPWFVDDDYWNKDGVPFAQKNQDLYRKSQYSKDGVSDTPTSYDSKPINGAGIDLSPGIFDALGISGEIGTRSAWVEWQFVGISTFDRWPVDTPQITSQWGWRDLDNNLNTGDNGKEDFHDGIDLRAAVGTNVRSVANGVVHQTCEGYCSGFGYNIIIKHNENLYTKYSHLSRIYVEENDNVDTGQVIALSGNTGYSQAPHLDFKVYTSKDFGGEKGVDPTKYLPPLS